MYARYAGQGMNQCGYDSDKKSLTCHITRVITMCNRHDARFLLGSVVPPAVAYPNVPLLNTSEGNSGDKPPYCNIQL